MARWCSACGHPKELHDRHQGRRLCLLLRIREDEELPWPLYRGDSNQYTSRKAADDELSASK